MDTKRDLLRHCVATLSYRGGKVLRGAPADFAGYRASDTTRTPAEILAHLSDLLDWALDMARGGKTWKEGEQLDWEKGAERFFASATAFDQYLASSEPLAVSEDRLFQGPIADALTHVGQIAILRRLAGTPIRAENYFKAEVESGRVGAVQRPPVVEFD